MRIRNPVNDMMCEPPPLVQVTKGYVSALLETLADPEGGVREASAEALATLFKFLGEAKVMPFMPDLDNLKLEKIKVSQWNCGEFYPVFRIRSEKNLDSHCFVTFFGLFIFEK
jgi:hypothetical protein